MLQRRHLSSVRVDLANGTKQTPLQNRGNLLSELHVPHKQCLTDVSNAFSASFTSICRLSRGFTVSPIKRAYSALHPQALTECSLLDFGRSSIVEMLYLDLEDLKQSKPDQEKERKERRERESRTPFIKSLLGASVPRVRVISLLFI